MEITYRCPECQAANSMAPDQPTQAVSCAACGQIVPFTPSESILGQNRVDACPRCGDTSFYVQRDFNQKLGLAIVVVFGLVGLFFVYINRPMLFYVCLGAGALVDLLLYRMLPEVTVCYRCKTAFRQVNKNPQHGPFDLHIADLYDGRSQG